MIDLRCGICPEEMTEITDQSIDLVLCDPPYPCIRRPYGMLTEPEWHDLMHEVVRQSRRVLKPHGSAVFVLQPNSRKVGSMRAWLWEFMAWCCKEWNMVQDAWWWNIAACPTRHCQRTRGLMRPSLKLCMWIGDSNCYRDQGAVLWSETERNAAMRQAGRALTRYPSGQVMRRERCGNAAIDRGGVTPFNVIPIPSGGNSNCEGHPATTPLTLCDWWIRYLTRPGDTVLDPFCGSGTVPLAAVKRDRHAIGIDKELSYIATSRRRIDTALAETPLLNGTTT